MSISSLNSFEFSFNSMNKDDKVNPLKLLLIGDSGIGKTSLLSRFTRNEFDLKCAPTNGVDIVTHDIVVDNNITKIEIWDHTGREPYHGMTRRLLPDANGILLVYDISNAATFENATQWFKDVTQLAGPKTIVRLIGNKSDLEDHRSVSLEKAEKLAVDHGLSFTETSAFNGSNVQMIFQWMVEEICAAMNSVSGNDCDCVYSTCSFISDRMTKQQQQQQQQLFQIILVDIRKAADTINPTIQCVEKPLQDDDLNYVALSYRWGELEETPVDTKVQYTAIVKSFHLREFYELCYMMTLESDLKDIDYVWVDAICVDQVNYERRKATIYQMSNIYERATHILAVPDLHADYLAATSTIHMEVIQGSNRYGMDLYHLIHGNMDQLADAEEKWLDEFKVPSNPVLRQLLKTSTDHFTNGLMTNREHHRQYNSEEILDHIFDNSQGGTRSWNYDDDDFSEIIRLGNIQVTNSEIERFHDCDEVDCPLDFSFPELPTWREKKIESSGRYGNLKWSQCIQERSTSIRRSMKFMADLIEDWSTRVWVISEYNIAKKKNNLKYWFVQLGTRIDIDDKDFTFFKFDFEDPSFSAAIHDASSNVQIYLPSSEPVYLTFHQTMLRQLKQQTFFEMMLKSKASKNEDRFYAVFPLTKYKNAIKNKDMVNSWNIYTFTSVRLKLFELMDTKDKLNFLFLSAATDFTWLVGITLPTFATTPIRMVRDEFFTLKGMTDSECNFDINSTSAITLYQSKNNDSNSNLPYLNLKPMEYYTDDEYVKDRGSDKVFKDTHRALWSHLQAEDPFDTNMIVCIPSWTQAAMVVYEDDENWDNHVIYLNGNFETNIWVLESCIYHGASPPTFTNWTCHTSDEYPAGFNIY